MNKNDCFYRLEMLLLILLSNKDYTSEDITHQLLSFFDETVKLNEGIVFTKLYFFIQSHLVSTYTKDQHIYYHIEDHGRVRLETLKRTYKQINQSIDYIMEYSK